MLRLTSLKKLPLPVSLVYPGKPYFDPSQSNVSKLSRGRHASSSRFPGGRGPYVANFFKSCDVTHKRWGGCAMGDDHPPSHLQIQFAGTRIGRGPSTEPV